MTTPFLSLASRVNVLFSLTAALYVVPLATTAAQEHHSHSQESAHHAGLHFSHPLFTESVSPDTKRRLNAGRAWEADAAETEFELKAEHAFHRSFSIEIGAPFAAVDPEDGSNSSRLGNLEVFFKFANYAFEAHGVLLGYGLEIGLPTGDDAAGIGSDHLWELEPVLNIGFNQGPLELVGFTRFGIPFNQSEGDDVETELAYDVSGHISSRVQGLVELNAITVLSGEEAGATVALLSPGLKVAPVAGVPLFIGAGVQVPLTAEELDATVRGSLFYHF